MAQVIGSLREDKATNGEKAVLKLLKENLPKEYSVYVECPLPGKRNLNYPDFIILTNYGVIVLEVKDWVYVNKADRYTAQIFTRQNKIVEEKNPVDQARKYAVSLAQELDIVSRIIPNAPRTDIPWGFAAVLPNLPTSKITQLRSVWGEGFVLNKDDLDPPLILDRLKFTIPENKVRPLTKSELDLVRATINPTVFLEIEGKQAVILNEEQEQIISEPIHPQLQKEAEINQEVLQDKLFEEEKESKESEVVQELPDYGIRLARNASIRLVRGVAGSGKTLVLTQRARYLAAQYPEWKIAVFTFNKQLKQHFDGVFKSIPNVKVYTFYGICFELLHKKIDWKEPENPKGWLEKNKEAFPLIAELGLAFVEDEIQWIKEMGICERDVYLIAERKGRGNQHIINTTRKEQLFDILLGYNDYLHKQKTLDWADIPQIVLKVLDQKEIHPEQFDVVLIDEAQDFAPAWLRVINYLVKPDKGLLFLADDPAQSIYRFYSWRQKGVHIVGRTRWLRIPYRNTLEIFKAARTMIEGDELLNQNLNEDGIFIDTPLDSSLLRSGERPLLQKFASIEKELEWIRTRIIGLKQNGIQANQIAILKRRNQGMDRLQKTFRDLDVVVNTYHAYKGLEFEFVFLTQLQETFANTCTVEDLSEERRLIYMAMTRARQGLFMSYQGRMPEQFKCFVDYIDQIN